MARLVFMGSPAFAVPALVALHEAEHDIALVVTQPDRPAGRWGKTHAPEVKVTAGGLGLDVFQPDTLRDEAVQTRLRATEAEAFVVAAYGKILPQAVLDIPRHGCVNVHGSLLPRWRGPSPIVAAILAGDPETGVSIMELVRKMDAGPVIARAAIAITPEQTTATLEPQLASLGARLLVDVLPGWLRGELTAEPQDESQATYCQLLTKADGHLRASMTVDEAWRAVRAYNPWPTASVEFRDSRLNIWGAHPAASGGALPEPGTMEIVDRSPAIAFAGGWLVLDEVQKVGGKRIHGQAFLNGERGQLPPAAGLA